MKCVFNAFADPRDPQYDDYLFTFAEVIRAIAHGNDFKTNFMAEMSSAWDHTREIYVINEHGEEHRIDTLTLKDLRQAHNVYKMWRAGSFCNIGISTRFKTQCILN